ncbi:MAG: HDOD domain-containing protein [Nitrospinota bacterium]|nr:MAG: HDOD domain-containing protein [Nitrospinota bacterium]
MKVRQEAEVDVFVARQPIFDRQQRVYAYELLFRSGPENFFTPVDGDKASSKVMTDSFLLIGGLDITGGKRAFINFTRDLLLQEYASLFPPEWIVVEILETVGAEPEVIAACQKLKRQGYLLALDDVDGSWKGQKPLIELADILKIDFALTSPEERKALQRHLPSPKVHLLAEKVETREEFRQAVESGYTYFQGYFFQKPEILSSKDVPKFKVNYLTLLQEVNQPELDFQRIETVLKRELSLSYKLLRYINSAAFGLRSKVHSLRQALVLLGETAFKKWASLMILADLGRDKPSELVVSSIIRAKFAELLAPLLGLHDRESDLFLLGMFSQIDVLIGRPMTELIRELPLPEDVKHALSGKENRLRTVYEAILAYEKGEWERFATLLSSLGGEEAPVSELYLQAVSWATQTVPWTR